MLSFAFLTLVGEVSSHSLVLCTDLSADRQTCNGYARSVDTYYTKGDGYIIDANKNGNPCNMFPTQGRTAYTSAYPMATAAPGETKNISWVSNNHQKANPANSIPDSQNSGDTDVNLWLTSQEFPGRDIRDTMPTKTSSYSNCFTTYKSSLTSGSAGTVKYLCTATLTMPTAPGIYTYVWNWNLGSTIPYYSCFDVQVGGTGATAAPSPPTPASAAPTAAPTAAPGTPQCVDSATQYCIGAGFAGCSVVNGVQYCGNYKGGDTTSKCPQVVTDFCTKNYPGTECQPANDGSGYYRCVEKAPPAAGMVSRVVDTIPPESVMLTTAAPAGSGATPAGFGAGVFGTLAALAIFTFVF